MNNNNEIGQFIIIYSNKTSVNVVSLSLSILYCAILAFLLKGSTSAHFSNTPKVPASLLWNFGVITKKYKGDLNRSTAIL